MINDDDSWCFSMDTHGYDWELPELPYPCVIFHMGWTIPINGGIFNCHVWWPEGIFTCFAADGLTKIEPADLEIFWKLKSSARNGDWNQSIILSGQNWGVQDCPRYFDKRYQDCPKCQNLWRPQRALETFGCIAWIGVKARISRDDGFSPTWIIWDNFPHISSWRTFQKSHHITKVIVQNTLWRASLACFFCF